MSKKKIKTTTRVERQELLERLWAAHARKLVEKIENTPATELDAAAFNAAAKLLSENGVNADSLDRDDGKAGKSLAEQARQIPSFDNNPDEDLRAALHTPVPVPPATEENIAALKRLEEN